MVTDFGDGIVWRTAEDIIDEIGLAPLDLISEILRLERQVNAARNVANHFRGNANIPGYPKDMKWEMAERMLRSSLDD
jgi:hypothetical protein